MEWELKERTFNTYKWKIVQCNTFFKVKISRSRHYIRCKWCGMKVLNGKHKSSRNFVHFLLHIFLRVPKGFVNEESSDISWFRVLFKRGFFQVYSFKINAILFWRGWKFCKPNVLKLHDIYNVHFMIQTSHAILNYEVYQINSETPWNMKQLVIHYTQ